MVTKIKKRRSITAPDEFISFPNRILNYIQENLKRVIFISTIFVFAILLSLLARYWHQQKKENALSIYTKAERLINQDQKEAINMFNHLLKEYPHMGIAKFSYLKLAYIYEQKEDFEKAISLYEKYLENTKDNNPLRPFVLHAIICDYERLGKIDSAKKYLKMIVEKWKNHAISSWAYAQLGLILEREGKLTEAYNMYKNALESKDDLTPAPSSSKAYSTGPAWLESKIKALSDKKKMTNVKSSNAK